MEQEVLILEMHQVVQILFFQQLQVQGVVEEEQHIHLVDHQHLQEVREVEDVQQLMVK